MDLGSSLGAIGGAVGGVAGGLLTNASNKREAERNRNWQEYMSNTAHQRAKRDLEKAGLNPLLAAQDAASTPGGAQATLSNAAEGGISSALEARRLKKDIETADVSNDKVRADTKLSKALEKKANVEAITGARMLPEADLKNKLYNYLLKTSNEAMKTSSKSNQMLNAPSKTATEQFFKKTLKSWDEFPNRR